VVHIVAQVAGALTEAHERGLVHRDVKPANVFLCQRGGVSDVVKVLDFGLVKELARDAGVTDTELVAGTPAFLAPEAITAPDQLGPAADLYALGAVAYYLLAGKQVFTGATVVEVCGHHVHTAPKPFDASLAIPTELEALVLRCLAKKPADRPASARELGRALASLGTSWTEGDAERWWIDSREALDEKRSKQSDERTFLPTMDVDLTARAGHHASGSR
jgi:eukaryotic-like serine/threonine-protein kinase